LENKDIDITRVPQHVAIIMDGNGRWAKKQGLSRLMGHETGVGSVREVIEAAGQIGIKYLTLYTFSKENWNRPVFEVSGLMNLLVRTIRKEIKTLAKKEIKLLTIGDISGLSSDVRKELNEAIETTKHHSGITVVLALNYSAKWDIARTVKVIAERFKAGKIKENEINEELITKTLCTAQLPEPELIIRTGGEQRISNFLLWEAAYSEFYFTPIYWPEFKKQHFIDAIKDYQSRERRFGKISEQILNEK